MKWSYEYEKKDKSTGVRTLDRYVFSSWVRIFVLTALGFPLVSILINLTDTLNKLLDRGLTMREIVVSYIYSIPENAFIVMPASVLFATVFTVGAMGRYSELTAAKAGGMSFHRVMLPVFVASVLAMGLAFVVGEMAPGATARQLELQKATPSRPTRSRYNFVYRGDDGWVYTVRSLELGTRQLKQLLLERQGRGLDYPGLVITADSASYDATRRAWEVKSGTSRVIAGPSKQATFAFRRLRLRALTQTPADLLADANKLIVEQALKLALPATCLIIALFGAPLAVQAPRAGAAIGVAISLGTTVVFLLLTQIMKAVGAGGLLDPTLAAWLPNLVFLLAALVLLGRVRT